MRKRERKRKSRQTNNRRKAGKAGVRGEVQPFQTGKEVLTKQNRAGGLRAPNLKRYWEASRPRHRCKHQNQHMDYRCHKPSSADWQSHRNIVQREGSLVGILCRATWMFSDGRMKLNSIPLPWTKISWKCGKDIHTTSDIRKPLIGNRKKHFRNFRHLPLKWLFPMVRC